MTKFHFLQFQKWSKINFWTGKKFKTARNAISRRRKKIYLISRVFFCLDFFKIIWPTAVRYLRALCYSVFPNVFYINWHLCWKKNCLKSQIWVLIFLSLSTTNSGLTEVRNPDFSVIRSHSNWKIINLSKKSLIKNTLKKAKLMLYCTKENKYQANCWESAAFRDAGLQYCLNRLSKPRDFWFWNISSVDY